MGEIPISFRRDGPICARARRSDQTVNAVIKDQWRRVDCGVQDLLETDAIEIVMSCPFVMCRSNYIQYVDVLDIW
jgi:hypothetical protein